MADPLSIVGLVTSVISLGLQVTGGLFDYLDAVKGQVEELSSAKQQATNMKDLLLTIQDLLPRVKDSWPTSATLIERHVQSCNTEISALYALLSDLSQPASSSSGIRLKLAEQKRKLTYPFNRTHLSLLKERLFEVNSALQTALHATGLDVSITTRSELRQVHNSSVTTRNQVQQIHDVSITTQDELRQLHDVSITTSNQLQQMHNVSIATRDELRQMCDELSAMCQSTTAQAQSPVAWLSLRTGWNTEGITKMTTGIDSIEAAVSLASKQSLLSTSIETVTKYNTLPSSSSGDVPLVCLCRPLHKMTHYRKHWGCLSFSYKISYIRKHLPGCPFSLINSETQAISYIIEYSGLKILLRTAVVLSFTNTRSAKERSISPGFTYYPTVDECTAPTFRILRLARYMVQSCPKEHISDVAKVLQHCFNCITVFYSRGKACPKDINSDGESIMHLVANLILRVSA
ncbi:hypothetical protein F4823DRAFT_601089 [Ustulina deusta]|nr:hypothetical protein F4823DRAFT_601089 [Ustulina deusta]